MNLSDPTLPIPSMEALRSLFGIAKQMATPPDPYQEAGRMVQQARQGDYLGALETGFGAMPNTGAIKAYHGSPHSFDRFDLSKIGTGEGAQAYGHGLYFADNEATAESYRRKLSGILGQAEIKLNDKLVAPQSDAERRAWEILGRDGLPSFRQVLRSMKSEGIADPSDISAYEDVLRRAKAGNVSVKKNPGHMYEVRINAEPEHFLDWDKPFANADEVERFAAKFDSVDPDIRKKIEDWGYTRQQSGQPMPDGNDIMREVFGGVDGPKGRQASSMMQEAGIPGIKYLDQGSRTAGEGSRNYVVFDDKLIDIMRKYGFVPFGAGVGMGYDEKPKLRGTIDPSDKEPQPLPPPRQAPGAWEGLKDYASTSIDQLAKGAGEIRDAYRNRDIPAALDMVAAGAEPFTGTKRPVGMGLSLAKWLAGYGHPQ